MCGDLMAVKKVYKVTDEILKDEYQLFGQSGVMNENGIMLIDFAQMGQYIIENCHNNNGQYNKQDVEDICKQWSKEISDIILNEAYENAISDIIDDEELELI